MTKAEKVLWLLSKRIRLGSLFAPPRQTPTWVELFGVSDDELAELLTQVLTDSGNQEPPSPVPLILACPTCGTRHIDEGEHATRPHKVHACQDCGLLWQPALVPTVGVRFCPGAGTRVAMKKGDVIPEAQVELVCALNEIEIGRFSLKHPRCGRVVVTRQLDGRWVVTQIERPDTPLPEPFRPAPLPRRQRRKKR